MSNKDQGKVNEAWAKIISSGIQVGQHWYHHKTNSTYRIVALSVDEARLVPVVTYTGLGEPTEKRTWTRDLDVFLGKREDDCTWRYSIVEGT